MQSDILYDHPEATYTDSSHGFLVEIESQKIYILKIQGSRFQTIKFKADSR